MNALVGTQVILRPLTREDAPALAEAASESREAYRWTPVPDGLDGASAYIEHALETADRMAFAIVWFGRVVGSTSFNELTPWKWPEGSPLQRHGVPDTAEIGYTWLARSAQRTRVNTEAKLLLLRHAFEVWQVHSVFLKTDSRNTRSRTAIERLGARFDGIRRADRPGWDGNLRSTAYFSILRDEWPDVEAKLESRLASAH